jgi:hypothetical protein
MITAMLNPVVTPSERIKHAMLALTFAEGWHTDLAAKHKAAKKAAKAAKEADQAPRTVASQFITSNAYQGLRLNVSNLVAYTYAFAASDTLRTALPYAPFLLNSQMAEHRFRTFRAMAGDVNFTFAEFLRRSKLQEVHEVLKARHADIFRYPDSEKSWSFDETARTAAPFPASYGVANLLADAHAGRDAARLWLKSCGIQLPAIAAVAPSDSELDDVNVDDELHNIECQQDEVRGISHLAPANPVPLLSGL